MENEDRTNSTVGRVTALEALVADLRLELDRRFMNEDKLRTLSLSAIEGRTQVAQHTADKAVVKSEAAAERSYTESLIEGLRRTFDAQLVASKEAILAALVASDRAKDKAEQATDKRFESVNEFRAQLSDQQNTFVTKSEVNYKFGGIEKALDEDRLWQRRIELKFAEYVTVIQSDRRNEDTSKWREAVDRQLTAAASKSGLIYAIIAVGIAAGGLLVAVFNLFTKTPLSSVLHQ